MVKQTFQWFFDFSTVPDTMQILTVKAGGKRVIQRLSPFFSAYKYFKLGKVSLKAVPASTLPVDPTGLSYEAGETTVDPRDQLSPGLMRITNGEFIQKDLTHVSPEVQRLVYANMLLDRRWFKWSLQSGFKKSAIPLAWQVAQLHEDLYPGMNRNMLVMDTVEGDETAPKRFGTRAEGVNAVHTTDSSTTFKETNYSGSTPYGLFQVGKNVRMGWLPTDAYQPAVDTVKVKDEGEWDREVEVPLIHPVPEIELFNIITPPAYKTKYYYRVYVTETVYFSEPVTNGISAFITEGELGTVAALDRFIRPKLPTTEKPTDSIYDGVEAMRIQNMNDGHGEGA